MKLWYRMHIYHIPRDIKWTWLFSKWNGLIYKYTAVQEKDSIYFCEWSAISESSQEQKDTLQT